MKKNQVLAQTFLYNARLKIMGFIFQLSQISNSSMLREVPMDIHPEIAKNMTEDFTNFLSKVKPRKFYEI